MMDAAECLAAGYPVATASVTFIATGDGGRRTMPHLSGVYRPHIVIQDPGVRRATVGPDGKGNERYLGVQFISGVNDGEFGVAYESTMVFAYHGRIDYSQARSQETFTIREGARVVGFGTITSVTWPAQDVAG